VDRERLLVGRALARGPVGGLAVEPIELVDGPLPATFEQVPIEVRQADGEASGGIRIVAEPAGRRWQRPVGPGGQLHGGLLAGGRREGVVR
jgi:hypothetical protein